jgi:hypothetical protein
VSITGKIDRALHLDGVQIRGLTAPVWASRVSRESNAESRFEALRATATPLVGFDEELEMLDRRWRLEQGRRRPGVSEAHKAS